MIALVAAEPCVRWSAGPRVREGPTLRAGLHGRTARPRAAQGSLLLAVAAVAVVALTAQPWPGLALPRGALKGPTRPQGPHLPGRRLLQSSPSPLDATTTGSNSPTTVTMEVDTVQKDCIVFANHYYDIAAMPRARELLPATDNLQPTTGDCCRSCHTQAQQASINRTCNAWHWCPDPSGCYIVDTVISMPYQGCQLMHIEGFSPNSMGNLTSITGPGVPFTAGGAIDISVSPLPGYDLVVGTDFGGKYDYPCPETARDGRCFLEGNLSTVAAACTADPLCLAFVFFPDGIDFSPPSVAILKGGNDVPELTQENLTLNPSGASYLKSEQRQRLANASSSPAPTSPRPTNATLSASTSKSSSNDTPIIAGVSAGLAGFLLLVLAVGAALYFKVYRPRKLLGDTAAKTAAVEDLHEEGAANCAVMSSSSGGSFGGPPGAGGTDEASPHKQGTLRRSNSPPSVVDAHLEGVLGQAGRAAAAGELGSSSSMVGGGGPGAGGGVSHNGLADAPSPFMMLDEAMIAAMQAAAPAVAQLEGEGEPEASPSVPTTATARSGSATRMLGPSFTPLGSQVQLLDSSGTFSVVSGGSGHYIALPPVHPQYLHHAQYLASLPEEAQQQAQRATAAQQLPQQLPGLGGWEHVEVAQVAAGPPHSTLSSPPASMANGSTARELLEAFAKLYRQRPTVDYSALAGMLEEPARAGSSGGSKVEGSATMSPQSTLDTDPSGGGPAATVRSSGNSAAQPAQQHAPAAAAATAAAAQPDASGTAPALLAPAPSCGFFRTPSSVFLKDPGSSMSMTTLPDMPWSDWALKPEEVEICRRPDGSWWQLGSGACGTVFKGLYHGMQPVAVKVLHQREDGRRSDVFMREVTMLKGLRDRNIVQFLGASLDGSSAMLVTEFMEFGDLWRALPILNHSGERVFGWHRRGRHVALDVARGLHYLHHKRVVHLDLKSANILLSRHGTAKIGDIGMARVLNRDYLTALSGLGTFAWSAPEVLAGRRCTEKVDIFSFGVVLWEICTGEVPVRGDMRALQPPQDCPQEVVDLYERCTAEDPSLRPTAMEIVELLLSLPGG